MLDSLTFEKESYDDFMRLGMEVTTSPFVYTFYDGDSPVYVGKTTNIWGRLSTHLASDKWIHADRIFIERMKSHVDMDLYEISKINKFKPKLNKAVSKGEQFGVVDISPAKTFSLVLNSGLTTVVRKFHNLAKSVDAKVKIKYGHIRVFFCIEGTIAKGGKKYVVKYSYNTKTGEVLLDSVSQRKVFTDKVCEKFNEHFKE